MKTKPPTIVAPCRLPITIHTVSIVYDNVLLVLECRLVVHERGNVHMSLINDPVVKG